MATALVSGMASDRQLDLFSGTRWPGPEHAAAIPRAETPRAPLAELDADTLLERIRRAGIDDCHALALEAGRRRAAAAVPALEALCRRFIGFGLHASLPEQAAALEGLALIGGIHASRAVGRLIADRVVQGPGLAAAIGVAARLGSTLPAGCALALLRHQEPRVRADACRCLRPGPEVAAVLLELLGDLHAEVARAAACALGRMGRREARPLLLQLLHQDPSAEVIDAVAAFEDEECLILLGRLGRARPDLAEAVLAALDATEQPRAAIIARSVRRSPVR